MKNVIPRMFKVSLSSLCHEMILAEKGLLSFSSHFPHNHDRVDADHAEGVVENNPDVADVLRRVEDEVGDFAGGVEVIDVDRRVANAVVEGGQVPGQFQNARRPHRVADEALRVIDVSVFAVGKDPFECLDLLHVALHGRGGVRIDNIDF